MFFKVQNQNSAQRFLGYARQESQASFCSLPLRNVAGASRINLLLSAESLGPSHLNWKWHTISSPPNQLRSYTNIRAAVKIALQPCSGNRFVRFSAQCAKRQADQTLIFKTP